MEKKTSWVSGDLRLDPKTVGLFIAVALIVAVIAYNLYA